jgi:spermidine synthase
VKTRPTESGLERRWLDGVAFLCFFLSGAAGLIYEICWIRRATAIFGATTFAASSVVSVFLLGLALGSATFGIVSPHVRRPLHAFAFVEIAVGFLAVITPAAFEAVEPIFGAMYRASPPGGILQSAGRIVVVGTILLPPTFLMGAALPLFCREYVRDDARVAAPVGWLYGTNTLGALVGCLACGLWLLPAIGLARSVGIGAALSLTAALAVLAASYARPAHREGPSATDLVSVDRESGESMGRPPGERRAPHREARLSASSRRAVPALGSLVFAAGFAAIGGEVLWIRFLGLLVPNGVHAYTFTLASVLLGIVAGSALAAGFGDRARYPALTFGALQIGHGMLVLITLHLPVAWLRGLAVPVGTPELGLDGLRIAAFLPCLLLVPPAILSGASFPLAVRLSTAHADGSSRRVGGLMALNTLGGIGGALAFGFWGLPQLGLEAAVAVVTGISIAAGVAAWWLVAERGDGRALARLVASAAALALWALTPRVLGTSLPRDHLIDPGDELVAWKEGLVGNVAVIRRDGELSLEIDRWWQGQLGANHQRLAAHLPMLIHPDPRRVLVVGVGAGQTPSRFLHYPIERLDCAEIEPAVFDAVRAHFGGSVVESGLDDGGAMDGWMDDSRVRLLAEDGRTVLAYSAQHYDVISLELGQVFRPSVAPFYNVELYARARERLAAGGILSQFISLPFFETHELRRAVASFLRVFPESFLWYNGSELILLGLRDGLESIEATRLARELRRPAVWEDLDFSHWGGRDRALRRPEVLLGGFLLGPTELARLAAEAAPFRDDRPELEYRASARALDPVRELESVGLIAGNLAPVEHLLEAFQTRPERAPSRAKVSPEATEMAALDHDAVRAIQRLNVAALVADAQLRRVALLRDTGRLEELESLLRNVHARNPEHVQLNRTLGELSLARGRTEEALGYLDAALLARPGDALALKAKAAALHLARRVSEAIPLYRAAIRQRPNDAELLNGLGAAQAERNNLGAARRYFERALDIDPDYEEAQQNLSRLNRLELQR